MKFLLTDRRVFIAFVSIACLTAMAMYKGIDTSMPIATIAAAIAAANATQKAFEKKYKGDENERS